MPVGIRRIIGHATEELAEQAKRFSDKLMKVINKGATPVDRGKQQLVSGASVPEGRSHTDLKRNGQQKDYVVRTAEERAKGFVRPVRVKYRHVGATGPQYAPRDLTEERHQRFQQFSYA